MIKSIIEYKNFFEESITNILSFRTESMGYHNGQSDLRLVAELNGEMVGKMDYSVYNDIPYIQWIEVMDKNKKRSGIGKQMIKRLQQEYPDTEINVGGTTDLGSKFFDSLPKIFDKDTNYGVLIKKLQSLKHAEKKLISYVEKTGNVSEKLTNLFNKIYDEMWETENKLKDVSPGKTKFNIPEISESYPENWNLETFKSLRSFSKRIKYCNDNLQRLASGSSRIAYKVDDDKVLKLAKNKKGIAQNNVEKDWFVQKSYPDIVAKVFDVDENDLWLEMELAKKLTPNKFKQILGFSIQSLDYYLIAFDIERTGKTRYSTPEDYRASIPSEELSVINESEFTNQLTDLISNMNMPIGDFGRLSSFGECIRNGKPAVVIIDMGLSKQIASDFYGVN